MDQEPISFQGFTPPGLPLAESLHLSLAADGAALSRKRVVTPALAWPGVEQAPPSECRKKLSAGAGVIVTSSLEARLVES